MESSISERGRCADGYEVKCVAPSFRPATALGVVLACLLIATGGAGCSTTTQTPALATGRWEAEIAVTNLTPYPWRIALRTPQGVDVKAVNVQPREAFAVVVTGGDYLVEQTLVSADPAAGMTRNFKARFEAGEQYRWSLATLLSTEETVAP